MSNNQQGRDNARWLANELAELRRLQKSSHITPRLPYSSVNDGQLTVTDSEGNVVDVLGPNTDRSGQREQSVLPGPPPSKPSVPIVSAYLGTAQVSWDGLFVEEYLAPDMNHLEVHGSTEGEEFDTTSATLLGTITNLSGGTVTAGLEYGTWFFKLVAVTSSDAKSVPSDATSSEVLPLVEAPDMVEVLDDIDARYDGVITEAGKLGTRLDQAAQDLAAHETRLDTAEQRVNDAFIEIGEVDQATQANATAASNAQTKADQAAQDALTATGIANGKGKALIQSTVPAVEDRNAVTLWIDTTGGANTPKRWNGSAWVTVTDKIAVDAAQAAANARSKAQEALDKAGSALTNADNAMTMAGSKSKVFYSTSAPSGTGTNTNDLWRRIDASKNVIGEWYWSGAVWQSSQITTSAIANLDVGKLTVGTGVISDLVAQHIAGQTAAFQTVDAKNIFASTGTLQEATISKLWSEVVMSKKITAQMLAIGDFETIAPSLADSPEAWELSGDVRVNPTGLSPEGQRLYWHNTSASAYAYGPFVSCKPGDEFYASTKIYRASGVTGGIYLRLYWYKANKTASATPYSHVYGGTESVTPNGATISGSAVAPADAVYVRYGIGVTAHSGDIGTYDMVGRRKNGGELIVDGAITATKIAANSIEADKIKANAITADKIQAGAVTAVKIAASTITADKLLIGSAENIIPDPDYETTSAGPIWYAPASGNPGDGINTAIVQPSKKISLKMDVYPTAASNVSLYGPYLKPDYRIPVTPGETYRITSWAYLDADSTGNMTSIDQRVYHFATRNGTIINGSAGAIQSSNVPLRTWFEVGGTFTVPSGSYFIAPRLTMYYPGNSIPTPAGASWYVSTPKIVRAASGELIVDGAIDGKVITGATLQTDKAPNVGVKLSNSGIEAYSPQGEKTFSITAGQGVDYIGVWGNDLATIDDAGNIIYPSGVEPEQMVSLDYLGGISGSELSISDYARFDGNLVINGDPLQDSHLGTEAPGEWGPVINGRSLLGTTFTNFVDEHPQVNDGHSWLTPLSHGFKANAFVNDDVNRSTGKAGGLNSEGRWTWSGKGGGLVDRMMLQQQVEIVNNRGYFLTYSVPAVRSTDGINATVGASVVRYSTGSLNVNTGSTLNDTRIYIPGGGNYFNPTKAVYFVGGQDVPAGTITFGIQTYVYDNRTMETTDTADARFWNLSITDMGLATKGTTGRAVDLFRRLPVDTTPETTSPPPPAPVPKPVQHTKTWNANWWGTYDSSGTNSYYDSRGRVAQGRPPGAGIQRGLVGFPSVTGTLSGATIKKVEVYVYAAHWYYSSGGTLVLGTHGLTSKPGSYSSGDIDVKRQKMSKPEGRWITLPSSVHAGFKSGDIRGIQAFINSTSLNYYGYLSGSRSKLRITYTK